MKRISTLIVFLVTSHLCVAQNGYNYPRPEGPSTIPPVGAAGIRPVVGGSPGFPSSPTPGFPSSQGFPGPQTTPGYGTSGGGYPSAASGRPSGPAFPATPVTTGFGGRPQSDAGITPSGSGFGGAGFPGGAGAGFGGRPTGPAAPSRPGFPSSSGPSSPGFGARPSTQFPGTQTFPDTTGGSNDDGSYPGGDYSAIPGQPGQDYPIYTEIPQTSFDCNSQQYPGYYADVEAQCQVFHICALNRTFDFLCPNGTIFSQETLVCVWWNQFDCNSAPALYGNNAFIYDYSQTGQNSGQQSSGGFQGGVAPSIVGRPQGPTAPASGFGGASRPGAAGFPATGRPTTTGAFPGQAGPAGPAILPAAGFPGAPSAPAFPGTAVPVGPAAGSFPTGPGQVGGRPTAPAAAFGSTPRPGFSVQGDTGFGTGAAPGISPPAPNREYLPPRRQ